MTLKIITAFILFSFLLSCNDVKKTNGLNTNISSQTDTIRILTKKIDALAKENAELKQELHYWFSDTEIDALKEKGIADPVKNITDNLYNNPKLIPYPGILGGTVQYNKITLLTNQWAIADFDDGHFGGAMLLKYTIQKDSSIKWKVIDHHAD